MSESEDKSTFKLDKWLKASKTNDNNSQYEDNDELNQNEHAEYEHHLKNNASATKIETCVQKNYILLSKQQSDEVEDFSESSESSDSFDVFSDDSVMIEQNDLYNKLAASILNQNEIMRSVSRRQIIKIFTEKKNVRAIARCFVDYHASQMLIHDSTYYILNNITMIWSQLSTNSIIIKINEFVSLIWKLTKASIKMMANNEETRALKKPLKLHLAPNNYNESKLCAIEASLKYIMKKHNKPPICLNRSYLCFLNGKITLSDELVYSKHIYLQKYESSDFLINPVQYNYQPEVSHLLAENWIKVKFNYNENQQQIFCWLISQSLFKTVPQIEYLFLIGNNYDAKQYLMNLLYSALKPKIVLFGMKNLAHEKMISLERELPSRFTGKNIAVCNDLTEKGVSYKSFEILQRAFEFSDISGNFQMSGKAVNKPTLIIIPCKEVLFTDKNIISSYKCNYLTISRISETQLDCTKEKSEQQDHAILTNESVLEQSHDAKTTYIRNTDVDIELVQSFINVVLPFIFQEKPEQQKSHDLSNNLLTKVKKETNIRKLGIMSSFQEFLTQTYVKTSNKIDFIPVDKIVQMYIEMNDEGENNVNYLGKNNAYKLLKQGVRIVFGCDMNSVVRVFNGKNTRGYEYLQYKQTEVMVVEKLNE